MQDVLIQPNEHGVYDLVVDPSIKDYSSAGGFETAIPVTLFTDARADSFQLQDAKNRRGWVGNISTIDDDFELGSQLWIFDQSRNTDAIRNQVRTYVRQALQWFIDFGFSADIGVGQILSTNLSVTIPIVFKNIENVVTKYMTLWRRTDANKLSNTR